MSEPDPTYEAKKEAITPVYTALLKKAENWRQICAVAGYADAVEDVPVSIVVRALQKQPSQNGGLSALAHLALRQIAVTSLEALQHMEEEQ